MCLGEDELPRGWFSASPSATRRRIRYPELATYLVPPPSEPARALGGIRATREQL